MTPRRILTLAVIGTLLLAAAGAGLWRHHQRQQMRRVLPALPDLNSQPAPLVEALRRAEAAAVAGLRAPAAAGALGRLYHANGFNAQAQICWAWLAQREPADGHWTYYLADLAAAEGDDDGTGGWLRETVRRSPAYAPAWLKLADWEFKRGDIAESETGYRRRLALLPGDAYAQLGLARIASAQGDTAGAQQRLESAVAAHPEFYPAHNLLAEILSQAGQVRAAALQRELGRSALRFRDADDPWLEALRADCYQPERLILWASIEVQTRHGDAGEAYLKRAIALAPMDPVPREDLGRVYLQRQAWVNARQAFQAAAQLPGATSEAFAGLSETERDAEHPDSAVAAAQQGLARFPQAADLETALGNSLLQAGQLEPAVAAFRRAAALAPTVAQTHYDLGIALLRLKRRDEARGAFDAALGASPDYLPALRSRAELELEGRRWAAAEPYVRRLFTDHPGLPLAQRMMAEWCLQEGAAAATAGQASAAEARLREGLEADPNLPELHARLGLLYGEQNRIAAALDQLAAYRRLAPRDPLGALLEGQAYLHGGRPAEARRAFEEAIALAGADNPGIVAASQDLLRSLP